MVLGLSLTIPLLALDTQVLKQPTRVIFTQLKWLSLGATWRHVQRHDARRELGDKGRWRGSTKVFFDLLTSNQTAPFSFSQKKRMQFLFEDGKNTIFIIHYIYIFQQNKPGCFGVSFPKKRVVFLSFPSLHFTQS